MTADKLVRGDSPWQVAWRRLRKNVGAIIGLSIIIVMILMAIFAPLITPFEPTTSILEYAVKPAGFRGSILKKVNPSNPETPTLIAVDSWYVDDDTVRWTDPVGTPYREHVSAMFGASPEDWHDEPLFVMGTDRQGRDIYTRLVYGLRVSLSVGLISESIALMIGIMLGALAGFYRGWVDDVVMWGVNVVWAFPSILLVIAFSVMLGQGFWQTFIAIGVSSWVDIARIVRGQFFSIREQDYIEATRAFGFGSIRVVLRHMLPNAMGPIIVLGTAGFATAIIAEASLSFIGLGVQPPMPSWGQMIREGVGYVALGTNWEMTAFPCLAMALAVFAVNLFGDGLRDVFDPKTTQRS